VMTMERFMAELAPTIWPPGNRTGNTVIPFAFVVIIYATVRVELIVATFILQKNYLLFG